MLPLHPNINPPPTPPDHQIRSLPPDIRFNSLTVNVINITTHMPRPVGPTRAPATAQAWDLLTAEDSMRRTMIMTRRWEPGMRVAGLRGILGHPRVDGVKVRLVGSI